MWVQENQTNDKSNFNSTTHIKLNVQSRRTHVREFKASGETMVSYCKLHGLTLSTFKNWVSRYSDKQEKSAFIPITVNREDPLKKMEVKKLPQRLEIHRGDVKVILLEMNDLETVLKLIKAVMSCN